MITSNDIAWLAGLLEGEGTFLMHHNKTPLVQLVMSDHDVVMRAASMMSVTIGQPYTPKNSKKPLVRLAVCGSTAISWMLMVYQFIGVRRKARIREIMAQWKVATRAPRAPRGRTWIATCHPDRPMQSRGLCKQCYAVDRMRRFRARRKAAA